MYGTNSGLKSRLKYFLLGVASVIALFLLTGSADSGRPTLNFGRYQLSSCAAQLSDDSGIIGAFVIDTVSGETKTVYIRTFGETGKSVVIKNDLKKSFSSVE